MITRSAAEGGSFTCTPRTSEQFAMPQPETSETSRPEDPSHNYLTIVCMNCGYHFRVPQYCGNRFCSVCSGRRRARTRARITHLIHHVQHRKGYRLKMITLTIRNMPTLSGMVKTLVSHFKSLRKTKLWKTCVDGGCFVIEVTGKPGSWHAHLHVLVSASFIRWETLHSLWKKITGSTGVFIQNIPGRQAINYVTKYVTKSECDVETQRDVSDALKGTRLFQPFGSWYAVANTYPKDKPVCPECKTRAWGIEEYELNPLFHRRI